MRNLKSKDFDIFVRLRMNARESLTRMSRAIQIPVSTIYDRLKEHEGRLIKKHTSLIDFSLLGYNTRAHVCVSVEKEDKQILAEFLQKHQNINNIYKINNGFDYMVEGVFQHIKDMEEFCDLLREKYSIKDLKVFYIIDELQREVFMSRPEFNSMLFS